MKMTRSDWRAVGWGALGVVVALILLMLCGSLYVGWARAANGDRAWGCLNTPKCVQDVLRTTQKAPTP